MLSLIVISTLSVLWKLLILNNFCRISKRQHNFRSFPFWYFVRWNNLFFERPRIFICDDVKDICSFTIIEANWHFTEKNREDFFQFLRKMAVIAILSVVLGINVAVIVGLIHFFMENKWWLSFYYFFGYSKTDIVKAGFQLGTDFYLIWLRINFKTHLRFIKRRFPPLLVTASVLQLRLDPWFTLFCGLSCFCLILHGLFSQVSTGGAGPSL